MMSARALWRILVLPVHIAASGLVFGLAMAGTSGSVIGALVPLAPWVVAGSSGLAILVAVGGLLRARRRLEAVRRGAGRRSGAGKPLTPASDWLDDDHGRACMDPGRG